MPHAAALAHAAIDTLGVLKVLALLEATRITGVARNMLEFARMAAAGIGDVHIATAFGLIRRGVDPAVRVDALHDQAALAGIPVAVIMERYRYDRRVVESLRRLVDTHAPAIIETHHIKSHCLVALSGLWRRHTWVAFHHGYTQTDAKVRAYNQVDRWSLRHAAHVVTTNEPFAATLAARGVGQGRITVLHNGVREPRASAAAIDTVARTLAIRPHERIVLAVGRLSHEKGQAHLLRAAAAWRSDARLVIVGDGPDRQALEKLAATLGVADRVTCAGMTGDVAPYYALADVFVLPSLSEGSPNVLLEAMASGLPVVATSVGGVPEIAANEMSALLGPSRDPRFLATAVDRLLDNPGLGARLGAAAKRAVLSRHTPERRAETLSRLYAALAGRPAAVPCAVAERAAS